MALALVEESAQLVLDAYATHGDASRTPGIAVIGRQHLRCTEHRLEIIHRLTLAHEHDIRQLLTLRQGIDLVQDIGSGEIALETLLTRLTEQAIHLAAHLTRYAKCGTIAIGDEDTLYKLTLRLALVSTANGEEVFDRTVLRALAVDRRHGTHNETLFQPLTIHLREIGHLVDIRHMLLIEPLEYLACRKRGHAQVANNRLQLVGRES